MRELMRAEEFIKKAKEEILEIYNTNKTHEDPIITIDSIYLLSYNENKSNGNSQAVFYINNNFEKVYYEVKSGVDIYYINVYKRVGGSIISNNL